MGSTLNEVVKISDTGFIDSINSLDLRVNNNTKLFIDSSGNVGIGTTTPSDKLDVQGGIFIKDDGITLKTEQDLFLRISKTDNMFPADYGIGFGEYNDLSTLFLLRKHGAKKLYFDCDNVGIGTTDPSHKLHVNGTIIGNCIRSGFWFDYAYSGGAPSTTKNVSDVVSGDNCICLIYVYGSGSQAGGATQMISGAYSYTRRYNNSLSEYFYKIISLGESLVSASTPNNSQITFTFSSAHAQDVSVYYHNILN